MTPFHVLATSVALKPDMLGCLRAKYPVEILFHKAHNNKTMLDYLLMHTSSKAVLLIDSNDGATESSCGYNFGMGRDRKVQIRIRGDRKE
mmetsp:Transcript_31415/g.75757  ORF Transcript_31415/g.75757 Transcript_31415/m.75757 type:complete len:90 (+) Transcript_31415:917-1186(+)